MTVKLSATKFPDTTECSGNVPAVLKNNRQSPALSVVCERRRPEQFLEFMSENSSSFVEISFCIILLSDKQTNKHPVGKSDMSVRKKA